MWFLKSQRGFVIRVLPLGILFFNFPVLISGTGFRILVYCYLCLASLLMIFGFVREAFGAGASDLVFRVSGTLGGLVRSWASGP